MADEDQAMAMARYLAMLGGYGQAVQPPLDKYGYPEPIETSDQKAMFDVVYKMTQALSNPDTAGLFGGANLAGTSALEPVQTREEVQRPGYAQLQYYLSRNEGTLENLIAQHIANGGTASSAYQQVADIISVPEDDPALGPQRAVLLGSIPQRYVDDPAGSFEKIAEPDLDKVWEMATDLESAIYSDPAYDEENNGRFFNVAQEETPVSQLYRELGVPDPSEQYTAESFEDPNTVAMRQMLSSLDLSGLVAERDQAQQAAQAYQPQMTPRGVSVTPPPDLSGYSNEASNPFERIGRSLNRAPTFLGGPGINGEPQGKLHPDLLKRLAQRQQDDAIQGSMMRSALAANGPVENTRVPQHRQRLQAKAQGAQNRLEQTKRQVTGARRTVYNADEDRKRVAARVSAGRARREGRTPHSEFINQSMAMLRALGIGI